MRPPTVRGKALYDAQLYRLPDLRVTLFCKRSKSRCSSCHLAYSAVPAVKGSFVSLLAWLKRCDARHSVLLSPRVFFDRGAWGRLATCVFILVSGLLSATATFRKVGSGTSTHDTSTASHSSSDSESLMSEPMMNSSRSLSAPLLIRKN